MIVTYGVGTGREVAVAVAAWPKVRLTFLTIVWLDELRLSFKIEMPNDVIDTGCVYSFALMAPPVPIEQVEGTLREQMELLREELANL